VGRSEVGDRMQIVASTELAASLACPPLWACGRVRPLRRPAPRMAVGSPDTYPYSQLLTARRRRPGHVLGGEGKKASPGKASVLGARPPNLADAWARIHLARLCAALLLAEWTSAAEFAGGVGAPLLRMLVLLATRCGAPRALTPPRRVCSLYFRRTSASWRVGATRLCARTPQPPSPPVLPGILAHVRVVATRCGLPRNACLMAILYAVFAERHGHSLSCLQLCCRPVAGGGGKA